MRECQPKIFHEIKTIAYDVIDVNVFHHKKWPKTSLLYYLRGCHVVLLTFTNFTR